MKKILLLGWLICCSGESAIGIQVRNSLFTDWHSPSNEEIQYNSMSSVKLKEIDNLKPFLATISDQRSLQNLFIIQCQFDSEDVQQLAHTITNNRNLEGITIIDQGSITAATCRPLLQALIYHQNLKRVFLRLSGIDQDNFEEFDSIRHQIIDRNVRIALQQRAIDEIEGNEPRDVNSRENMTIQWRVIEIERQQFIDRALQTLDSWH